MDFANTQIVTMRRHEPAFRELTSAYDCFPPDGMPLIWCLNAAGAGLIPGGSVLGGAGKRLQRFPFQPKREPLLHLAGRINLRLDHPPVAEATRRLLIAVGLSEAVPVITLLQFTGGEVAVPDPT